MPRSAAGTVGAIMMVAQTEGKTRGGNVADNGEAGLYSVRPNAPQAAAAARDYPSARFINGEFHAQTFSDEALLSAMAE